MQLPLSFLNRTMFLLSLIINLFGSLFANTQMPKVFVDVESIKLIDPLRTGFQIILDEHFLHHYLNPTKLPTIFVSALPLAPQEDGPGYRRMMYREDIQDSAIQIEDLRERTWYYVCVEFENVVRRHARGNTSTSCQLYRTLDEFGKRAESAVRDIQVSQIGADYMEFQLAVDGGFPVQLMIFLESGSCPVQAYVVSNPKTIRVRFPHLAEGFNYGRLCIREQPLVQLYSMMGRDIHASQELCHFENLKTQSDNAADSNSPETPVRKSESGGLTKRHQEHRERPMASNLKMSSSAAGGARTRDPSTPSMSTYHVVIFSLVTCVIANILMPAIPLAYLITCSSNGNRKDCNETSGDCDANDYDGDDDDVDDDNDEFTLNDGLPRVVLNCQVEENFELGNFKKSSISRQFSRRLSSKSDVCRSDLTNQQPLVDHVTIVPSSRRINGSLRKT